MNEVTIIEGEGLCVEVIEKLTRQEKKYHQVTIDKQIFYDWQMESTPDMEGSRVKWFAESDGRYNTLKSIWTV